MLVYVVRRLEPTGPVILSAWTDVYYAKYEAMRWEQDSKIPHDYVTGNLSAILPDGGEAMPCLPCEEKKKRKARERADRKKGTNVPEKGTCEHGVRPWWDCEQGCREKSTYHFSGNFR